MALSTEATVQAAILQALRASWALFGFKEIGGNFKDYPIEFEQPEKISEYLRSRLEDGRLVSRVWSVDVRGAEEPLSLNATTSSGMRRVYDVSLAGHFSLGVNGEGYKTAIEQARLVRKIMADMGIGLSGTTSRLLSAGDVSLRLSDIGSKGSIVIAEMVYRYERVSPDW